MQQQAQLIRTKCNEVFAKAKELWPHLSFDKVGIRFDLKGRAAGMACRRGTIFNATYYMRFNTDMLTREAFDHVLNDTVPHEIAHIVCFMDPKLGRDHDYGWSRVCRQLGGTGARTHNEEVVYGKGATYEYTTDRGHKVRVSEIIHRKIQAGRIYTWKHGKGRATQTCAYSIVGHQGRTLAAPIVKKAVADVPAPAVPIVPPAGVDIGRVIGVMRIPAVLPVAPRVAAPIVPPVGVDIGRVIGVMRIPAVLPVAPRVAAPAAGESKAAISRRIMLSGHRAGHSYEQIINAMIAANGYDRQLARATFKANAPKIGIPASFY